MKALPDEEGIETPIPRLLSMPRNRMKALPDEEGIETSPTSPTARARSV